MKDVPNQRQLFATLDLVDTLGSARQKLEKYLSTQAQPMTPKQIATNTKLNENTVRRELQRMLKDGAARRDMNHAYSAPANESNDTPAFAQSGKNSKAASSSQAPMPAAIPPAEQETTAVDPPVPKLAAKFPKIKIDEILFIAYTNPAPMTRTAPLDERETVIYRVLPEDLADKLSLLQSEFEREMSMHLRTVVRGRLYFARYPLDRHKSSIEKLVKDWNTKYAEFAEYLFDHREELEKTIADFYTRHNVTRKAPELSREYLLNRFRINMFMIPFSLRSSIVSDVVSNEEWRQITIQAKETVIRTYREEMNEQLGEFFESMKSLMQRLHEGKMVTAQSIGKLHRLYNEALEGLAVTQEDEKYSGAFTVMGDLINALSSKHDKHQSSKGNKDLAAGIVAETLRVTKTIGAQAKPILDGFESVLAAERQPAKKTREGIREIFESLTLPS